MPESFSQAILDMAKLRQKMAMRTHRLAMAATIDNTITRESYVDAMFDEIAAAGYRIVRERAIGGASSDEEQVRLVGDGEPIRIEAYAITEAELAEIGAMRLNQLDRIEALAERILVDLKGVAAVRRIDAELEGKRSRGDDAS